MGNRPFVRNRKMNVCLGSGRRDRLQSFERASREFHCRPSRWQIDDAHVALEHAFANAGPERLRAGLFGGEALGIGRALVGPRLRSCTFDRCEYPVEKSIAVTADYLL